ncbi:WD40/YVTN/BNR-like repeat-containing protein [Chloroflexota bacterium]
MKKLMAVLILVGMLFVTIGASFTHEINKDVTLEQSSLFDQLKRREDKGKVGWAVGSDKHNKGFIIYTEDGGEHWVSQVDEGGLPMLLGGVSAVNQNTAWVVGNTHDGYGTILRTRNRGKTWVRQGSVGEIPDIDMVAVSAVSPSTAWVVGVNGVILKTKNGGATWEQQAVDITPKIFFQDVFALDKNNVWATGGENKAYILHTSNGGKTWTKQGEGDIPPDVYSLLGIHAVNKDVIWTVGVNGSVLITKNGGHNWTETTRTTTFYHNNHVVAISDLIVWVAMDYSDILYSDDGGKNWDSYSPSIGVGSDYYMGITALNENEIWAVSVASDGHGRIAYTKDGGSNWISQINPVISDLRRISFVGALR